MASAAMVRQVSTSVVIYAKHDSSHCLTTGKVCLHACSPPEPSAVKLYAGWPLVDELVADTNAVITAMARHALQRKQRGNSNSDGALQRLGKAIRSDLKVHAACDHWMLLQGFQWAVHPDSITLATSYMHNRVAY